MNRDSILRLWDAKIPAKKIAEQLGISAARVYQILKDEGKSSPRRGRIPRSDLPAFAIALRKRRETTGLTQAQLAERCSMPLGTLRNLERGATEPLLSTAKKLADALGIQLDELTR